MSDVVSIPLADTSDMIGLHRIFREALDAAPQLVGSVAPGDTERAGLVAAYYRNVLAILHAHHEGEDELVTPRLVERCPEDAETVLRIAARHRSVLASLEAAETLVAPWAQEPTPESAGRLAAALAVLGAELTSHLDEEEREVLPVAARCINVAEWGELPAHGMRSFSGDLPWLMIGLVREQLTPAQLAMMDAHMPPPVADFWARTGRAQFEEFVAELRR